MAKYGKKRVRPKSPEGTIAVPSPPVFESASKASAARGGGGALTPTVNCGDNAAASAARGGGRFTPIHISAAASTDGDGTAIGDGYPDDVFCVIIANGVALTAGMCGVDSQTFRKCFDEHNNQIFCASGLACTNPAPVEGSTHRCCNCALKYHLLFQCGVSFVEDFLNGKVGVGGKTFHRKMLSPYGQAKYVEYNGDISNLPICNMCQHKLLEAMGEDDEGNQAMGEDNENCRLRDSSPDHTLFDGGKDCNNYSDPDDGPTDAEVSRFGIQDRLLHYLNGEAITTKSRKSVEAVIMMEALSVVSDMYPMCLKDQEKHIKQHYLDLINGIRNDLFENTSVRESMIRNYFGAKTPNHQGLYRHAKKERSNIRDFGSNFPGINSLNELPSGHTQIRDSINPYIIKLWKARYPVSVF